MRSVKKGNVSFGLVSVAVKMYSATEDHDVKAHMHHGRNNCLGAIGQQRVCKECGEVVDYADIVKGVEHGDQTVIVTNEDLATLDEEQGQNFEVLQFVHQNEIDPILFESTYYLDADKGAEESYALLHHVLTEADRFGIVKFTYRQKTRMGVLRVYGDVLAVHTIRWHDEVRGTSELLGAQRAKRITLNPQMVKLGHAVIDSLMDDWDPEAYTDTYTERLGELVEAKANGESYVPEVEDEAPADVADLLAKLEASIAVNSGKKKKKSAAADAAAERHPAGRAKRTAKKTA